MAVNEATGNVYVVGFTSDGDDYVVMRLNAALDVQGTTRTPTFLGTDEAFDVALDASGRVYVVGRADTDDIGVVRYDANLTAAFRVTKRAAQGMLRARKGRIIFMSSVVGLSGAAGQTNYAASKSALVGFARSLARELGSRSITVNVVAPGPVETDMTAALGEKRIAEIVGAVPLQRMATADEIAGVVAFLASADAAYITGAVIPVDGGLGMGH